jgi:uncharacterized protein YdeI (YjbR/CyaY-like superfamily)
VASEDAPHVQVRSRAELRDWLTQNHANAGSVWLVTFKKSHPDYLDFQDVVEELMCWGWVDSSVRALDDTRTRHLISPRKETSTWSAINKGIVARMRETGAMTPAGEAKIAAAQANGMWNFLDDVDRLEVPDDLAAALGPARTAWEGWTRSNKRAWLEKIKWAKTDKTRAARIAACTEAARTGAKNAGLT